MGLVYLGGKDHISGQIEDFENSITLMIEDIMWIQGYTGDGVGPST